MELVPHLQHVVATYGYLAVFVIVALESAGIPMPGETVLVTAAIFAASGTLKIYWVIGAAAAGAIIGDNCGYWIGRELGFPLIYRFGHYIRLDEKRLKVGQYLFLKHGGKIIFFGRFVAVLRAFAAFLAGVNRYNWEEFFSSTQRAESSGPRSLAQAAICSDAPSSTMRDPSGSPRSSSPWPARSSPPASSVLTSRRWRTRPSGPFRGR